MSIRARVAMIILLLEDLLEEEEMKSIEWKSLLNFLWMYTWWGSYLDTWEDFVVERCPEVIQITDDKAFSEGGWKTLSHREFQSLKKTYETTSPEVISLFDCVLEAGRCEFYSQMSPRSVKSMEILHEAIEVHAGSGRPLPVVARNLLRYGFEVEDGWGARFTREDVFQGE